MPVASTPTSAVIRRVSSSSRISASILRPGSSSVMSVVSHAGPRFNLARRRLKKPRTPGLSASFVIRKLSRVNLTRAAEPSGARMIRMMRTLTPKSKPAPGSAIRCASSAADGAAGACSFPDSPGLAADARSGARDLVQLAAALHRGRPLPGSVRRAPARSGSRPCRAAPGRWCSSSKAPRGGAALAEELERLGGSGAGARAARRAPPAFCAPRASPSMWCSSIRPSGAGALAEYVAADRGRRLGQRRGLGLPRERTRGRRPRPARRTGICSNRSRRARWGIIWRASTCASSSGQ